MAQPRSMAAALAGWGDLTNERERNIRHNAEEDRDNREREATARSHVYSSRGRPQVGAGMRIPIVGPAEQYAMAQSNLNRAMNDVQRENDSRVSQNREMRRMAHEQELMRMKTQGEMARAEADRDAMLIRELLSGM